MIGWSPCRLRLNTAETQPRQVKLIDKHIDRPNRPRPNSHPIARETTCSDCDHRQRQSASSNPPDKSQENHIIEGRFHTAWTPSGHWTGISGKSPDELVATPLPAVCLFPLPRRRCSHWEMFPSQGTYSKHSAINQMTGRPALQDLGRSFTAPLF